jgi:hypothetical protein
MRVSQAIIDERWMEVLNEVRTHAATIAESASFVALNDAAIEAYARSLPVNAAQEPELDPATHYARRADPDVTLAYVVTLDAINFGSGYFPHLQKRPGLSGYFTVASSLKDRFEASGPLSPRELEDLTAETCVELFGQTDPDQAVTELMGLFAKALNDLGTYVTARHQGSFRSLVQAAQGSAEQLVSILAEMPFYRDVGFYKRAQLTAADLSLANVAHFGDLDQLTIFADNLVPHVLRVDGVVRYDPELLERINREELIAAGSREEQEIRACALHAVELLKPITGLTAMQLDYVLWNRGQRPEYKAQPRHRTRTVFY